MGESTAIEVRMEHVEDGLSELKTVHRIDTDKLWKAVENIRQRPPTWTAIAMTILGAACGWFAH